MALSLIILLFFILAVSKSRKEFCCALNPISAFIGLFLFAFFILFSVDFIDQQLISAKLWVIYFLSFISYIIGVLLYKSSYSYYLLRNTSWDVRMIDDKTKYKKEIVILAIIVFISTVLYWADCFFEQGIQGLFLSLLMTRGEDVIEETSSIFLYFKMFSLFLSPYSLFYLLKYREKKTLMTFIIIFTFLSNIAYSRATFFVILLLDFSVYVYYASLYSTPQKKRKILYLTLFVLVLFFVLFSVTQQLFNKDHSIDGTFCNISISDDISTIFCYFSGGLVSPELYMDMKKNVPFLGHTCRFFIDNIGPLVGVKIDTLQYQPVEFVDIPIRFNTASIQYYIFEEGGFLWTIIFFLMTGWFMTSSYYHFRFKQDRFSLMSLCFITMMLLLSIRSYEMAHLSSYIYLFLLFFLKVKNVLKI